MFSFRTPGYIPSTMTFSRLLDAEATPESAIRKLEGFDGVFKVIIEDRFRLIGVLFSGLVINEFVAICVQKRFIANQNISQEWIAAAFNENSVVKVESIEKVFQSLIGDKTNKEPSSTILRDLRSAKSASSDDRLREITATYNPSGVDLAGGGDLTFAETSAELRGESVLVQASRCERTQLRTDVISSSRRVLVVRHEPIKLNALFTVQSRSEDARRLLESFDSRFQSIITEKFNLIGTNFSTLVLKEFMAISARKKISERDMNDEWLSTEFNKRGIVKVNAVERVLKALIFDKAKLCKEYKEMFEDLKRERAALSPLPALATINDGIRNLRLVMTGMSRLPAEVRPKAPALQVPPSGAYRPAAQQPLFSTVALNRAQDPPASKRPQPIRVPVEPRVYFAQTPSTVTSSPFTGVIGTQQTPITVVDSSPVAGSASSNVSGLRRVTFVRASGFQAPRPVGVPYIAGSQFPQGPVAGDGRIFTQTPRTAAGHGSGVSQVFTPVVAGSFSGGNQQAQMQGRRVHSAASGILQGAVPSEASIKRRTDESVGLHSRHRRRDHGVPESDLSGLETHPDIEQRIMEVLADFVLTRPYEVDDSSFSDRRRDRYYSQAKASRHRSGRESVRRGHDLESAGTGVSRESGITEVSDHLRFGDDYASSPHVRIEHSKVPVVKIPPAHLISSAASAISARESGTRDPRNYDEVIDESSRDRQFPPSRMDDSRAPRVTPVFGFLGEDVSATRLDPRECIRSVLRSPAIDPSVSSGVLITEPTHVQAPYSTRGIPGQVQSRLIPPSDTHPFSQQPHQSSIRAVVPSANQEGAGYTPSYCQFPHIHKFIIMQGLDRGLPGPGDGSRFSQAPVATSLPKTSWARSSLQKHT